MRGSIGHSLPKSISSLESVNVGNWEVVCQGNIKHFYFTQTVDLAEVCQNRKDRGLHVYPAMY